MFRTSAEATRREFDLQAALSSTVEELKPLNTLITCAVICLCKIAAPDTLVVLASDLGVVVGSEDLSVAGLALVAPALGHSAADAVKTGESGDLAEPATDENGEEGLHVGLAGGEDLTVSSRVELVLHDTVALNDNVHGVGLELGVALERLHAHLGAPLRDDVHVATGGSSGRGSRGSLSGGWLGGLAGRSRRSSLVAGGLGGRSVGSLSGGGLGGLAGGRWGRRSYVDSRAAGLSWRVDHGVLGRGLVDSADGGRLGDFVALGDVDSLDDSCDDIDNVLDVLVLVAVSTVGWGGERRAREGGDGESDGGAHFDRCWFGFGD
jgi:hypothetical protein